ncbi:MAG: hypothetical protein C0620_03300 [Desulfuromonas sp.]|nr:MAG: hypothetical protein C0620_03300 [Desulfuromonas sp.]
MSTECAILIIDDESAMRHLLRTILEAEGFYVDEAEHGKQGLAKLTQRPYNLVLCDIRMPQMGGLSFLTQALLKFPELTVIMMSAYGSLETALDCMKHGAYDYISKPFRPDEIILTLKKAQERLRLQHENKTLRYELNTRGENQQIIGCSNAIKQLLQQVKTLAMAPSPVLIHGETGTGKELIAKALHIQSPRHDKPFIAVNCSAISPQLVESELFGHRKGSFTGATASHDGLFAAADGGTLFLDEIGELPLEFQPKLLRTLQENEIRPIGETRVRKIDVRIVAATACNLSEAVQHGTFREDLFYRLAVIELFTPPLRDRPDDIPALCHHFLQKIARQQHRGTPVLTAQAKTLLMQHDWPGNIRELENTIHRIMIFHQGSEITKEDIPAELHGALQRMSASPSSNALSLKEAITDLEITYIKKALEKCHGNKTQAAALLSISLRALHYKIKEYNL